jgi:hypothetical protein
MILNTPIALFFDHGQLNMASVEISGWESLTFPFLAIPAWIFAGRGLDALTRRARLKVRHLALSLGLAAISAVTSMDRPLRNTRSGVVSRQV